MTTEGVSFGDMYRACMGLTNLRPQPNILACKSSIILTLWRVVKLYLCMYFVFVWGTQGDMYDACIGDVWGMYGACMEHVWGCMGTCVGHAYGHIWGMYRACIGHVWSLYGGCMGSCMRHA